MPYALIAGGSKGIGFAIANALAKRGFDLIVIARHFTKLEEVKNILETKYEIRVSILAIDLSTLEAADTIRDHCISNNFNIQILCNVAGIGGAKDYLSVPLSEMRYMIHLNLESVMALSFTLLPLLEKNKKAYILNVASLAGFAPIPVKNMYSATKSAAIFFSRALRSQLKEKNIKVSCLCPGPVFTKPEIEKDTKEKMGWFGEQMAVPPEKVGEVAVRDMFRGKFMIIPGTLTKFVALFVRWMPDWVLVNIYEKMVERNRS